MGTNPLRTIEWAKSPFSSQIIFTEGREKIGSFFWVGSSSAKAFWKDNRFGFRTEGWLDKKVIAKDLEEKIMLDEVELSSFKEEAKLYLGRQIWNWRFRNFWQKEWAWVEGRQAIIRYRVTRSFWGERGQIAVSGDLAPQEEHRILLGLYLREYYELD